ncbi:MAG: hypothetical protein QXH80_00045 [Candidatus Nanoarchaeia archaeon]
MEEPIFELEEEEIPSEEPVSLEPEKEVTKVPEVSEPVFELEEEEPIIESEEEVAPAVMEPETRAFLERKAAERQALPMEEAEKPSVTWKDIPEIALRATPWGQVYGAWKAATTPMERYQQEASASFARGALDSALAGMPEGIAAKMGVAPEEIESLKQRFPYHYWLGEMVGTLIPLGKIGKGVSTGTSVLRTILSSGRLAGIMGMGRAVAEAAKNPESTIGEAGKDMVKAFAINGALGTIFGAFGSMPTKLTEKFVNKYAQKLTSKDETFAQEAMKLGLNPTPYEITGSKDVGLIESALNNFITSSKLMNDARVQRLQQLVETRKKLAADGEFTRTYEEIGMQIQDELNDLMRRTELDKVEKVNEAANAVLKWAGSEDTVESLGRKAAQALRDRSAKVNEIQSKLYDRVKEKIPQDALVHPKNVMQTAESLLREEMKSEPWARDAGLVSILESILNREQMIFIPKRTNEVARTIVSSAEKGISKEKVASLLSVLSNPNVKFMDAVKTMKDLRLLAESDPFVASNLRRLEDAFLSDYEKSGYDWSTFTKMSSVLGKRIAEKSPVFAVAPGQRMMTERATASKIMLDKAFDKDIEEFSTAIGGDVLKRYNTAKAFTRKWKPLFNSDEVSSIWKNNPEEFYHATINSSPSDIRNIRKAIGEKEFKRFSDFVVQDLINSSWVEHPITGNEIVRMFSGQQLAKKMQAINRRYPMLQEIIGKDNFNKMVELAEFGEGVGRLPIKNDYFLRLVKTQPQLVANYIVRPNNATHIKEIRGVISEDAFRGLQEAFAFKILKLGDDIFSLPAFEKTINNYGDEVLRELFGAKKYMELKTLARIQTRIADMEKQVAGFSGTPRVMGVFGYAKWLATHPVHALIMGLTARQMAKFYLSDEARNLILHGYELNPAHPKLTEIMVRLQSLLDKTNKELEEEQGESPIFLGEL